MSKMIEAYEKLHSIKWEDTIPSIKACWTDAWTLATKEGKEQLAIMRQERDDLLQARAICPECAKKIDEAAGIDLVGLNRQLAAMTQERDWLDHKSKCLEMERASQESYLTECQAREQQLREALSTARYLYQYSQKIGTPEQAGRYSREHEEHHDEAGILLSLPQDDTALRQWGAKLLREIADNCHYDRDADMLRRKADELENKK